MDFLWPPKNQEIFRNFTTCHFWKMESHQAGISLCFWPLPNVSGRKFQKYLKHENIFITNHHFYLRFSKEINGVFKNKHSPSFSKKNRKYSQISRPNISVKWNPTRPGFPYVSDHFPIFLTENFRNIQKKNENILITNLQFYLRFSTEINGIFKNKHSPTISDISMIS